MCVLNPIRSRRIHQKDSLSRRSTGTIIVAITITSTTAPATSNTILFVVSIIIVAVIIILTTTKAAFRILDDVHCTSFKAGGRS